MGANQTTVVFLDDQNPPRPIEERLLEHRGSRALATEDEDSSPAIPGDADHGAGQPFHNSQPPPPEQRLLVAAHFACSQQLWRRVSHLFRLSTRTLLSLHLPRKCVTTANSYPWRNETIDYQSPKRRLVATGIGGSHLRALVRRTVTLST